MLTLHVCQKYVTEPRGKDTTWKKNTRNKWVSSRPQMVMFTATDECAKMPLEKAKYGSTDENLKSTAWFVINVFLSLCIHIDRLPLTHAIFSKAEGQFFSGGGEGEGVNFWTFFLLHKETAENWPGVCGMRLFEKSAKLLNSHHRYTSLKFYPGMLYVRT